MTHSPQASTDAELGRRALITVECGKTKAQLEASKKLRAFSVDESTEDGAALLEAVRQLIRQAIVNERKPPSHPLERALTIRICPRMHEKAGMVFEVPDGAVLYKHRRSSEGEKFELRIDGRSICFTYTRQGRLKLGRHAGFRQSGSTGNYRINGAVVAGQAVRLVR
jgi:hypothetical protein